MDKHRVRVLHRQPGGHGVAVCRQTSDQRLRRNVTRRSAALSHDRLKWVGSASSCGAEAVAGMANRLESDLRQLHLEQRPFVAARVAGAGELRDLGTWYAEDADVSSSAECGLL